MAARILVLPQTYSQLSDILRPVLLRGGCSGALLNQVDLTSRSGLTDPSWETQTPVRFPEFASSLKHRSGPNGSTEDRATLEPCLSFSAITRSTRLHPT